MEGSNGDMGITSPSEGWEDGEHVFILSTSGKPVYCRHGSEDRLATLSGVMQALVSFVQSAGDSIRGLRAGNTTIEFLVAEPVTIVAVGRHGENGADLRLNLTHLHNLLLFILTSTQLLKIYEEHKNFDLRRLLAGSERLIDYLLDNLPLEPGFFVRAAPCFPIDNKARANIANTISQTCDKQKEIVFGLLVVDGQVLCQIRMDRYRLHPFDVLLLLNLVRSTESFKSGETWSPLCLPQFDSTGFLHAYVSYLAEDCPACLLLLTVNKDIFYPLSEAKHRIVDKLRRSGQLDAIGTALSAAPTISSAVNIPQLRHFLYVLVDQGTYFWPHFTSPYNTESAKRNLIQLYRACHLRVSSESLKVLFVRGSTEVVYAYSRDNFHLYLVLEPFTSPEEASDLKAKVISWINRQEDILTKEDFLF